MLPPTWAQLETPDDAPTTLADPDAGVGALQISVALYKGGKEPAATSQQLMKMVLEWGESQKLGPAVAEEKFEFDKVVGAGASFHSGDDFIRAWYLSDGRSFALVTYVCEWTQREVELSTAVEIVRSIVFVAPRLG